MKLKPKFISVFIIILFLSFNMGCIFDEKNDSNLSEEELKYLYEIKLNTNESGNYFIYLPIIILDDGNLSKISDLIQVIEGNCSFSFIDTTYGKAINITSFSKIVYLKISDNKILDDKPEKGIPNIFLSMDNDFDGNGDITEWRDSYVQYNSFLFSENISKLNLELYFDVHYSPQGFHGDIKINSEILNGWQILNGTMNAAMA